MLKLVKHAINQFDETMFCFCFFLKMILYTMNFAWAYFIHKMIDAVYTKSTDRMLHWFVHILTLHKIRYSKRINRFYENRAKKWIFEFQHSGCSNAVRTLTKSTKLNIEL